jgi:hypothetical protein
MLRDIDVSSQPENATVDETAIQYSRIVDNFMS